MEHADRKPDADRQGSLLSLLEEYVRCESPTGDAAALRSVSQRIADTAEAQGAIVEWHPGETGDNLVCRFPGAADRASDAPLTFLAHADTVWPKGTIETMPWRVADGTAFGPGCFDMKGGVVAFLAAVTATRDSRRRPVTLIVVVDEEIGSPASRPLIERVSAGSHAVFGLEPPHPDGALKTSRWGSTRLRLRVTGRESHAALDPEAGVSAIDELVDQLAVVRTLTDSDGVLCNVGTITGGSRTNVVAGRAEAQLGLRFQNADVETHVLATLARLAPIRSGALVEVDVLSNRPAWGADSRHDELCARVQAVAASIGQHLAGGPATGAADTNITGWLGIPSVDGLGPIGQGAHAAHEQVVVASLAERADLLTAIIEQL